ncbi:MAG TPA: multicopper oxidase domain-containing protein [Acidobacteriaceae bacterium]|nr:multicopper oxidase domain-containing protein [Acidobacteriaceae bacterium]
MSRRKFLQQCSVVAAAGTWSRPQWLQGEAVADHILHIAPMKLELAKGKIVETLAYNGTVPGALLRMREGKQVTVDVFNDTDSMEFVHFHGLHIPADVDGSVDEGTPGIAAHGHQRYVFVAEPAGFRWYHTHTYAGKDLKKSTYTGQFGFLMIESPENPARYDQEIFLALHDWDPYLVSGDDGYEMVQYKYASINDNLLGAAEPLRVRAGQRVLLHIVNASATEVHTLALPNHKFTVVALDGNPVPFPKSVDQLQLAVAERIDAIVEMNHPGIWILGEVHDHLRKAGMGMVVEYANQQGKPQWVVPALMPWDYRQFGGTEAALTPDETVPLVFRSKFAGYGDFDHWTINGKSFPKTDMVPLQRGKRYRLIFDNQSTDDHPVHLHRHSFELVRVNGQPTSGVVKDVVYVMAHTKVEVDFVADNPGLTLFHCHQQEHMDRGFMMLLNYVG